MCASSDVIGAERPRLPARAMGTVPFTVARGESNKQMADLVHSHMYDCVTTAQV